MEVIGKKVKEVPEGYKMSKYGIVPIDWDVVKVKEVLYRVRKPVNVVKDDRYKQIGIRSHGKGIFYKEEVTGNELGNKAVFWIEPDCFIVNIVFAWELAVAKTTDKELGYIASHRFPMYKPIENRLDLDFITYLFKSPRGKHLLNLASPGGAGRNKTLGQKEFGELDILIPQSIKEQKKIADILLTWDKAIKLKEKLIEEKKEQKKGLLQKLLTGEVRLPGVDGEFKHYMLKQVLKIHHGKDQKKVEKVNGRYPILGTGGEIGRTDQFLYNKESVLIGRKGTIDKPFFMDKPFWTVDTLFYTEIYEGFYPKFIYYLFNRIPWKKYNEASGVPSLSASTISTIQVLIPSFELQKQIAQILTKIDEEIELMEKKTSFIKQQKKGLMQLLLTGKVCIKM